MTLGNLNFFLFLPMVFMLYHGSNRQWRWLVLLLASLGFYAAQQAPHLLVVLCGVTVVTFWLGQRLGAVRGESNRLRLLWIGIVTNLGWLVGVRLAALSQPAVGHGTASPWVELMMGGNGVVSTVGVSYFVFQAISYLVDVYYGTTPPERHLGRLLLFLAFFPKLLQGPIERANDLLPQLAQTPEFDYEQVRLGILLFCWGLFKKAVLADRLGLYVDAVYDDVHAFRGWSLLLATYGYAAQIYFDFSGYTDMAMGVAQLFGVRLTQNFHAPYLATSIAEFWRCWHISFSRWILDYIFRPLQYILRNYGKPGAAVALLATFLLSGLWHGWSWGFVIWGGLHGSYMAGAIFAKPYQKKLYQALGCDKSRWLIWWQRFITIQLVCFAWIFFRAEQLDDAKFVVKRLFHFAEGPGRFFATQSDAQGLLLLVSVLLYLAFVKWTPEGNLDCLSRIRRDWLRRFCYSMAVLVLLSLVCKTDTSFIYTNF